MRHEKQFDEHDLQTLELESAYVEEGQLLIQTPLLK